MGIIITFIFGSLIGSFLNVVILRLPREETLTGRSRCASCRHVLEARDLVPMVSFLTLRGKCRFCKAHVSVRYVVIEFATGLLFALSWILLEPGSLLGFLTLLKFWLVICVLIPVFVIDLEHYLILDKVIWPGALGVAVLNLFLDLAAGGSLWNSSGNFVFGFIAAFLAVLPFFAIWNFSKGRWIGFGDVKLMVFLGLALGWPLVFVGLFIAVLLGGLVSVILLTTTDSTLKSRVPFGTFLSLGAVISLLYGQRLFDWYWVFLGY